MPTYEYECEHCGIVFEHFQSMTEEPLKECIHPEGCAHKGKKAKVKRLLGTGAGIIFKGSGFYQTDYRSKDYHSAAKRDKDTVSASSSSTSSSSSSSSESSAKKESSKPKESKTPKKD